MYFFLKHLHMSFALISFISFLLRALLMLRGSSLLTHRLVLILPHVIDTVFLLSGFTLAFYAGYGLFSHAWLATKIALLMGYLLCVGITLSAGRTRLVRTVAFIAGVSIFLYIVGVARYKTPLGWLLLV